MTENVNTFDSGMVMDVHPLTTPKNILTNCLNGTLITFNGNEFLLQNDMGNGKVESAYLPTGYVPLGVKEYGGVIYVAAYNPFTKMSQIGSFPSPERITTADESGEEYKINEISFNNFNTDLGFNKEINLQSLFGGGLFNPGDQFGVKIDVSQYTSTLPEQWANLEVYLEHLVSLYGQDDLLKFITIDLVVQNEDRSITDLINYANGYWAKYHELPDRDLLQIYQNSTSSLILRATLEGIKDFSFGINTTYIADNEIYLTFVGSSAKYTKSNYTHDLVGNTIFHENLIEERINNQPSYTLETDESRVLPDGSCPPVNINGAELRKFNITNNKRTQSLDTVECASKFNIDLILSQDYTIELLSFSNLNEPLLKTDQNRLYFGEDTIGILKSDAILTFGDPQAEKIPLKSGIKFMRNGVQYTVPFKRVDPDIQELRTPEGDLVDPTEFQNIKYNDGTNEFAFNNYNNYYVGINANNNFYSFQTLPGAGRLVIHKGTEEKVVLEDTMNNLLHIIYNPFAYVDFNSVLSIKAYGELTDDLIEYTATPFSDLHQYDKLSQTVIIDKSRINSGTLELTRYNYYRGFENQVLNYTLEYYPSNNRRLKKVYIEFYDFSGDFSTIYEISNRYSFNGSSMETIRYNNLDLLFQASAEGTFTNQYSPTVTTNGRIWFARDNETLQTYGIKKNNLYGVHFRFVEDYFGEEIIHPAKYFRFMYTTPVFNSYYLNIQDFKTIVYQGNMEFKTDVNTQTSVGDSTSDPELFYVENYEYTPEQLLKVKAKQNINVSTTIDCYTTLENETNYFGSYDRKFQNVSFLYQNRNIPYIGTYNPGALTQAQDSVLLPYLQNGTSTSILQEYLKYNTNPFQTQNPNEYKMLDRLSLYKLVTPLESRSFIHLASGLSDLNYLQRLYIGDLSDENSKFLTLDLVRPYWEWTPKTVNDHLGEALKIIYGIKGEYDEINGEWVYGVNNKVIYLCAELMGTCITTFKNSYSYDFFTDLNKMQSSTNNGFDEDTIGSSIYLTVKQDLGITDVDDFPDIVPIFLLPGRKEYLGVPTDSSPRWLKVSGYMWNPGPDGTVTWGSPNAYVITNGFIMSTNKWDGTSSINSYESAPYRCDYLVLLAKYDISQDTYKIMPNLLPQKFYRYRDELETEGGRGSNRYYVMRSTRRDLSLSEWLTSIISLYSRYYVVKPTSQDIDYKSSKAVIYSNPSNVSTFSYELTKVVNPGQPFSFQTKRVNSGNSWIPFNKTQIISIWGVLPNYEMSELDTSNLYIDLPNFCTLAVLPERSEFDLEISITPNMKPYELMILDPNILTLDYPYYKKNGKIYKTWYNPDTRTNTRFGRNTIYLNFNSSFVFKDIPTVDDLEYNLGIKFKDTGNEANHVCSYRRGLSVPYWWGPAGGQDGLSFNESRWPDRALRSKRLLVGAVLYNPHSIVSTSLYADYVRKICTNLSGLFPIDNCFKVFPIVPEMLGNKRCMVCCPSEYKDTPHFFTSSTKGDGYNYEGYDAAHPTTKYVSYNLYERPWGRSMAIPSATARSWWYVGYLGHKTLDYWGYNQNPGHNGYQWISKISINYFARYPIQYKGNEINRLDGRPYSPNTFSTYQYGKINLFNNLDKDWMYSSTPTYENGSNFNATKRFKFHTTKGCFGPPSCPYFFVPGFFTFVLDLP